MTEQILKKYDIGTVKSSDFIRHNENLIYKVETDKGAYVLRIHENAADISTDLIKGVSDTVSETESEMALLYELSERGADVQRPVRNTDGELVTRIDDKIAALLEWAEGEGCENIVLSPEQAFSLGETVGRLRVLLAGYDLSDRIGYGLPLIGRLSSELEKISGGSLISDSNIETMKAVLSACKNAFDGAKTGYVHGDLGRSNFLLAPNGGFTLIDHSMSGSCILEYDLASLCMHFEREGSAFIERAIAGYESMIGTSADRMMIQLCECCQTVMFIVSQYDRISSQPWFSEAVGYWCGGIMRDTLRGKKYIGDIGLYTS